MNRKRFPVTVLGILCFCFSVFYLVCLIGVINIDPYPSEDSLIYENCSFVKYEYILKRSTRSKSERYHIYVEEYDKPLEIDNIVFHMTNEDVLFHLEPGAQVAVSIRESKDKLTLYTIAYDGVNILSYDDYVKIHTRNNNTGIVVLSALFCVSLGLCFAEYIHIKRHGTGL